MTTANERPSEGPEPTALQRLVLERAALHARALLEAAQRAANALGPAGLRALRDAIDARLSVAAPAWGAGDGLSEREAGALRLIALGYSNKEIAARMQVALKTLETYKARATKKLKLNGRVAIVQYAIRRGWLVSA